MRMVHGCAALILAAVTIDCAHLGLERKSHKQYLTATQRRAAIQHAQIWTRRNIPEMDVRTGPRGKGAFAPDATVTCDYQREEFGGASPKFGCVIDGTEHVKVRYGRDNGEIFAGVVATHLLWAIGFGADVLYPVHVVCHGCPAALAGDGRTPSGDTRFEFAAIERKMSGHEMEAPSTGSGWGWPELDLVDERAGGAPAAQRDALKLLAVMIQHTDNKAEQQKLLCVTEHLDEHDLAKCPDTFMMIHDVGQTFGRGNLLNRSPIGSANLEGWSHTPVWKDAAHCIGNLPPSQTGTFNNPMISEAGRVFLLDLLTQLSDAQLDALFLTARVGEKPGLNGTSGGSAADWVAAFKHKRDEIAAVTCS